MPSKLLITVLILIILFFSLTSLVWAPEILNFSPEEKEAQIVKLFFGGDIMADRGVKQKVMAEGGGDFDYLFSLWDLWQPEDLVFGNLEGPISDQGSDLGNLYSFRMMPEVLTTLEKFGFNILTVANNHAGDWGRIAFRDSLKRLGESGILPTGGGLDIAQASQPAVFEKGDLKIGYLGFSDVGPNWLAVEEGKAGILLANNPRRLELIKEAAEKVDFLIITYHFGEEYQTEPNSRQIQLAESSIDSGADLVIGHHPHVIQPVEKYQTGLIAYSLGNFIFDQYFSEETMTGLVLEVELKDGEIHKVRKHFSRQREDYRPEWLETKEFTW